MMSIVVRVDCLCLKTCNGIELLDSRSSKTGQGTENRAFDLRHLCVFNCVNQCVLGLGSMVLELFGGVLFTKGGDLVEVHFQIMCHLLCKLILRGFGCGEQGQQEESEALHYFGVWVFTAALTQMLRLPR